MNPFVANPEWGWWIVWYFFLGGIAAGAYFTATLIELSGREADRALARAGYGIAFPLIAVCGVLLILDLNRPERFWHMLVKSQVVHEALAHDWPWSGRGWELMKDAPLFKRFSPMSIGSWALLLFSLCSGLSFLGSLWPEGRLERWLRRGVFGRLLQLVGCGVGFFVAAYTGSLLTATNQPLWSDTGLIAPLFLASAASTGMAAVYLIASSRHGVGGTPLDRFHKAEVFTLFLEVILLYVFASSLPTWIFQSFYPTKFANVIGLAMAVGMFLPFILIQGGRRWKRKWVMRSAAMLILAGGFLLRYGVLIAAPEILEARLAGEREQSEVGTPKGPTWLPALSPEDGRQPGDPGADPGNRPVVPRSKVFDEP